MYYAYVKHFRRRSVVATFSYEAMNAEGEGMKQQIEENYPDIEVNIVEGNQDVYSYILSIE